MRSWCCSRSITAISAASIPIPSKPANCSSPWNCNDIGLDPAVEFLRRAGQLEFLPRPTPHDLEEVFRIATRSGMRLYLADYHLAKGNLAEAEKLINETGYHCRDKELADLRRRLNP
jgi:hypothetical protein